MRLPVERSNTLIRLKKLIALSVARVMVPSYKPSRFSNAISLFKCALGNAFNVE